MGMYKRYNPFALKRTLDALCGPVDDAKATRDGLWLFFLIVTQDRQQTEYLKVTSLGGFSVKVTLSEKVKSVTAVSRSDD